MTKSDSEALLSKLKSSVSKPAPVKGQLVVPGQADSSETVLPQKPMKPKPSKSVKVGLGEGLAQRLAVSLYQTDLERLDKIKEFMRGKGRRNLSDSEALRLACRAVRISDEFLDHYTAMQREDGRRRPMHNS